MSSSLRLRRGDHLVRGTGEIRHKVLSRATNGQVNLERVDDGTLSSVADSVLISEYSEGLLRIDRQQAPVSEQAATLLEADLESLKDAAREAAEYRQHFVKAMIRERRRQWPNSELDALASRVADENGFEQIPSAKTLRRWLERALSQGYEEVADLRILIPRNHACGGSKDKFGPEVMTIVEGVIDELVMRREAVSGADAYLEVIRLIEAKGKERHPGTALLKKPSIATFYRHLRTISDEERTRALEGSLAADNKHSLVGLGPQGGKLLHEVEIDHTRADVVVICPRSGVPIGRPTLTVALDRWSRMIVAAHIGLEPAGWRPAMRCLHQGIMPKDALFASVPVDDRPRHPWVAMGLMDFLVLDNGPEFHCAALKNAALQFGIELQYCPAGKPRYKGKIERLFRRMNTEFFHTLPGTTFSNPEQRGNYDSAGKACLTVEDLRLLMYRWVADIYCMKPHSFTKESPFDRWNSGLEMIGGVKLPASAHEATLALAEVEYRRLTRKGIELNGLHYSDPRDPVLRAMLNDPACPQAVKVRLDSDNIGHLFVEDFREPGLYIEVPCTDQIYARDMSLAEHHYVVARVKDGLKARQAITMNMLAEAKARLRADVGRIRDAGKLTSTRHNAVYPALPDARTVEPPRISVQPERPRTAVPARPSPSRPTQRTPRGDGFDFTFE